MSSCNTIVASGEMGYNPSIHIWNLKTGTCLVKFERVHRYSIKMLKFMRGDEVIVSVSDKVNNPIVIVDIQSK
jgi:WD40 repeat protein